MDRTHARSDRAALALELVEDLQRRFVAGLEALSTAQGHSDRFTEVEWLRDEGRHGGGSRFEIGDTPVFDRGSVNVSQVHYDDLPDKRLGSATALSTIIHPRHPRAPSVHIHVSWTQMRDGSGYWRVMADLNPSIPQKRERRRFEAALREAAPDHFTEAAAQGDRYFYIPALERHRGVCHFYLEGYRSRDDEADRALARRVGEASIHVYLEIFGAALAEAGPVDDEASRAQLDYHTLYLFQVLTLDRGTTSGLLVHDDNDVGILGSLPSRVDPGRLRSWRDRVPAPQDQLVDALVAALPSTSPATVTLEVKRALAQVVRTHYRAHPEALELQARGDLVPPTVQNHR